MRQGVLLLDNEIMSLLLLVRVQVVGWRLTTTNSFFPIFPSFSLASEKGVIVKSSLQLSASNTG